jgi:uncharacterized protein (TIGR03067 family)
MIQRLATVAALGLLIAVAGPARADDQEKIQGHWKAEKAVRGGMEAPADEIEKMTIEFKGNKAMPRHGDRSPETAEFKLDSSKSPKTIDITVNKGDKTDKPKGIYEIDGDTLKICFSEPNEDRPTKFESPAGSKVMLIVLKRVKN